MTSKTSLSSIKSDGRSNSSSNFYIKKMKIRNIVINTFDHSIISYKTEDNYKKNTKLYNIIEKIETKANILKCFKCWKKSKSGGCLQIAPATSVFIDYMFFPLYMWLHLRYN